MPTYSCKLQRANFEKSAFSNIYNFTVRHFIGTFGARPLDEIDRRLSAAITFNGSSLLGTLLTAAAVICRPRFHSLRLGLWGRQRRATRIHIAPHELNSFPAVRLHLEEEPDSSRVVFALEVPRPAGG